MTKQDFTISGAVDSAHESRQERPRPHLGASLLGHHCDRWLWLSFRWAVREAFPGRILRLFRRGHMEEVTAVQDLQAIGCTITHTGEGQSRVDFGGHVSGSMDGIIQSGLPGYENDQLVLEIKTHSAKSFAALARDGVAKSKPQHFVQMQAYMLGTGLKLALYYAVCKDNDETYAEIVRFDKQVAQDAVTRGHRIALSDRMPEPCPGAGPSWHQCKYCPAYAMCWEKQPTQQVNCRTCAHSTAAKDGTFGCEHWLATIPLDAQHTGCADHVLHPGMVPWPLDDAQSTGAVAAYVIDGRVVKNGKAGPGVYSSTEILANPVGCTVGGVVEEMREKFGAKIIG